MTHTAEVGSPANEPTVAPPAAAAQRANLANYPEIYRQSIEDPETYWAAAASELEWFSPWEQVLDERDAPFYKWFVGGKTNMVLNAIDRHTRTWRKNKLALIWEGEPGNGAEVRTFTYFQLQREVNKFANVLKALGVQKGERVAIYMGRCPEQAIAMLACAKIGAVHTVVYGGLSTEALRSRVEDAEAKVVVVSDGSYLNGKTIKLKEIADQAVEHCPSVEACIVVKRTGQSVNMQSGRDYWWSELMALPIASTVCESVALDAEDPFFIIYTSGSTGKPKGVVHTLGGYMVDVYSSLKQVLDFKEEDTLFCTSDAGWIVGHSIVLYGPLMHGITTVIYEGAPANPYPDRWWQIVERHGVTLLFTAPTGVRGLMRYGDSWPKRRDLSGLRLLACAGEPLNPEAWRWFNEVIGGGRSPIIDNWWQTETSRPMISAFASMPMKPGSCAYPVPGVVLDIVDEQGHSVPPGVEGALVIKRPWPGMLRTIFGDQQRYVEQYWSKYPGWYLTGDAARRDADGFMWIIGRTDDVIKVSGYRLGTAEVESALVSHPAVAEAAVIGLPHAVRGNAIHAFVILRAGQNGSEHLADELKAHVSRVMGPIAKPEAITFPGSLPKTRSGKIMRRVLKARALGEPEGDLSTIEG
ncbi:MAG: acetate--CoA ligase [Roseiflexaceae bacterium]|nr:acetate--CoA ligase [Roseiflexaceae bacterium]